MAILPILTYPDPFLRKPAKRVEKITPEIVRILNDMAETMYAAPGIGLAAQQVGVDQQLIVVDVGDDEETGEKAHLYRLVNPVIVEEGDDIDSEEGCLSIPDIRETITRMDSVTVEAEDIDAGKIVLEASGLLAICLQHEIDHLNGVLFIDHLSRLKRDLLKPKLKRLEEDFAKANKK